MEPRSRLDSLRHGARRDSFHELQQNSSRVGGRPCSRTTCSHTMFLVLGCEMVGKWSSRSSNSKTESAAQEEIRGGRWFKILPLFYAGSRQSPKCRCSEPRRDPYAGGPSLQVPVPAPLMRTSNRWHTDTHRELKLDIRPSTKALRNRTSATKAPIQKRTTPGIPREWCSSSDQCHSAFHQGLVRVRCLASSSKIFPSISTPTRGSCILGFRVSFISNALKIIYLSIFEAGELYVGTRRRTRA